MYLDGYDEELKSQVQVHHAVLCQEWSEIKACIYLDVLKPPLNTLSCVYKTVILELNFLSVVMHINSKRDYASNT